MSLNSIKFETTDIALLFKNSIVGIEEKPRDASKSKQSSLHPTGDLKEVGWKYLGENKKKTLVVVRYPDADNLPGKQLSFLTKLLAACHLDIADAAILNFHVHQPTQFREIIDYFTPKSVLLFGVRPSEFGMPMNFPDFQVQTHKDAVFVSSPALEIIEPDKDLKGKLWACLKKIFNL